MNYYNINSRKFFDNTIEVDMKELYSLFENVIPSKGSILDVGCGSGRDSKYFLNKGYDIVAIEPARELAKLASKVISKEVLPIKVNEITFKDQFTGIWACASLLHLPFSEINEALEKLYISLKDNGILFISLKYGDNEEERNGRFFCDYTEDKFEKTAYKSIGFSLVEYAISKDKRPGREHEKWLNVILRK